MISLYWAIRAVLHVLEWRRLLLLADATGAVHGADLAASVAEAAAVGHALCPGVRICVDERVRVGAARNWRHHSEVGGWRHPLLFD